MTHKQFEEFILSLPGVWLDYPFGEDVAVYKFGKDNDGAGKMVALVREGSKPLRVSLKMRSVVGAEFTRKIRNGFTRLSLEQETLEYNYLFGSID